MAKYEEQGKFVNFINNGKWGLIFLEKEKDNDILTRVLKVVGEKRVDETQQAFDSGKGSEVGCTFYLSVQKEWQGKWFASNPVCYEMRVVGVPVVNRDSPEKTGQADPFPLDDESDSNPLPF